MRTSSIEQILIVLWPGCFPAIMAYRDRRNIYNYIFLGLFSAQWLLYVLIINNILLGIFVANVMMFLLLMMNPYWSLDIEQCFRSDSKSFLKSKPIRVFLTSIYFYVIPPFLAMCVVLIVGIFFINEEATYDSEIAAKYLSWTAWHQGLSWILLVGWNLLQIKNDTKYAFFDFFFNHDICGEGNFEFSGFTAIYAIIAYIFLIILATVWGIEFDVSLI